VAVNSRPDGYFGERVEYVKVKDGSEEVFIENSDFRILYQNFDGDDTVDRIKISSYVNKLNTRLDNILIRELDLSNHESEFAEADNILLQERNNL